MYVGVILPYDPSLSKVGSVPHVCGGDPGLWIQELLS